ncbi:hypothetical protein [Iodobacter fluviatilis]|uniref:Uncharacterized protein n=1 Tax=Iodobacter fluviatilis TaxID=537 RepID=A0A377Q7G2_9NEIS|nr:hypothetical protein [Iodobacter fluviatilis]TCU89422.1 hypothetical protein EV682_102334 [Iodobacter fluviatilis]STQ90792.1 Uncharacterised protein [Iodobacter fluviatilis]
MNTRNRSALLVMLLLPVLTFAGPKSPEIPREKYTPERTMEIINESNATTGKVKECKNKFFAEYQESLYKHCVATNGGKEIGGGCEHVAYAYSIHERVIELALQKCKGNVISPASGARPNQSLEPTRVGKPPLAAQLQR